MLKSEYERRNARGDHISAHAHYKRSAIIRERRE